MVRDRQLFQAGFGISHGAGVETRRLASLSRKAVMSLRIEDRA